VCESVVLLLYNFDIVIEYLPPHSANFASQN
jgi:hypothetical protein